MEKGFSDSYSLNKVFPVFLYMYFVYYTKRLIKCIKVHYIMIKFKKNTAQVLNHAQNSAINSLKFIFN